ncbi:laccase [Guyanagaster necrorhizus]|uniref:Laccase n=1 Tax=Guyanagaster necrorhizus TaxID=856835 RepID=A0A9P8AWP0_9AGAR|nr:laccase [Guyanagaster necrorhizus MCA 3950]KAG7450874.1 laccase [Guyanagaster necrorhizus MCA 3950]
MAVFLLALIFLFESVRSLEVFGSSGDLQIVNKELAPDGVPRSTVLAGGTLPGPVISGIKGDRFQINVIDGLMDHTMALDTSIHWHGIHQHGTNFEDGSTSVTQCPIAQNNSFMYDFDVPDQAGTFWYHSHLAVQYCDGLAGPFIVYDGVDGQNDPHRALYDVDDETTIIVLSDWYHDPTPALVALTPTPNSTLINGMGRFFEDPTAPLSIIIVAPNKRYRLRVIAISCNAAFKFSIDNHNFTIIETDGVNIQPITANSLSILAAQRFSLILEANQPVGNYWIRSEPNVGNLGFENGINSAVLRYEGADDSEPRTSMQTDIISPREVDLHPLESPGAPGEPVPGGADLVLNITLGFDANTNVFLMNGVEFVPPTVPVLLQILSGAQRAQDLLPPGSIYGLPLNKTIEINLFGGHAIDGPHPFHLHGHSFDVVKSADSDTYNFNDPARRDTTAVAENNLTTIRFRTDNPGPWFLHCHIEFHLDDGMAVVFAEAISDVAQANPGVPSTWYDLCPTYYGLSPDVTKNDTTHTVPSY